MAHYIRVPEYLISIEYLDTWSGPDLQGGVEGDGPTFPDTWSITEVDGASVLHASGQYFPITPGWLEFTVVAPEPGALGGNSGLKSVEVVSSDRSLLANAVNFF